MHSNQPYFPFEPMQSFPKQSDYFVHNDPRAIKPRMPFHSIEFQPSDACPRNFIIFDQTTNRRQIMFHPQTDAFQGHTDQNAEAKNCSSLKEDSDDIDALLSTEYYETDDDDEVSTARTSGIYNCNSPDSCSNYESLSGKSSGSHFKKSRGTPYNEKKRKRVKKMVKTLRGILPGSKEMSNLMVLDEAVRYLKSLRAEVQKMGSDWKL